MKTFLVRIEIPGESGPEPEEMKELIESYIPFELKITRVWEPDDSRVCECGGFGRHVRWDPEDGEKYLCCKCWVAEGNAPAELHKARGWI